MNATSLERLKKVHPALAARVSAMAAALLARGIRIEVVQGLRTFAEQDALYAQGRTRPGKRVTNARGGQSNHNYGLAADVCPFVAGQPDWNVDGSVWRAIGGEGERAGLEWGGRWKTLDDLPHFQLRLGLGVDDCEALYHKRHGGLAAVWAEADRRLVKGGA